MADAQTFFHEPGAEIGLPTLNVSKGTLSSMA